MSTNPRGPALSKKQKKKLKQQQKLHQQQVDRNPPLPSREVDELKVGRQAGEKVAQKVSKKKVQKVEEEVLDSEDHSAESLNFKETSNAELIENQKVSFLISEINEKHYHSMKTILEKFAKNSGLNSSELASTIIENSEAGNVAVVDDDSDDDEEEEGSSEPEGAVDDEEDVCNGVICLLPFKNKLGLKYLNKITHTLSKTNRCLLVCERAINLPAFVSVSMHQVLAGDLKALRSKNKKDFEQKFGGELFCSSQVEIPKGVKTPGRQDMIYSRFEDFKFLQKSEEWWLGEAPPNSFKKANMKRLYYRISLQNYLDCAESLGELLEQEA